MNAPLAGRTILDCSSPLPGQRAGKLLAQKGAKVIKVESPSKPDHARELGAHYYDDLNGLKEVVRLELAPGADGRSRFEALVKQADGLIEGFRPATKLKLGLDEATLLKLNPKLCILSLVGYPENGPWRDRPGHDMNFQALTGFLSLFNELPGLPMADLFGAHEGAFALTAAMDAVARGQRGRRVVVSLSETLRETQSSAIAAYRKTGELPTPGTTLFSGRYPCYHVYTAACGRRIAVGALEAKFWEQVCRITGLPELVPQRLATGLAGTLAIARLQAALGSKPWSHWGPLFDQAECCVEPVLGYDEIHKQ